jgi:hypothetical protein
MPVTYELIASNVLGSAAASVTFSAIPSTYTDLVLRASARNSAAVNNAVLGLTVNGLTTTIYSTLYLQGTGSAASSTFNATQTELNGNTFQGTATTADTFTSIEFYIPNYTVASNKPISGISHAENNATAALTRASANLIRTTAAITSINLFDTSAANFVAGSSFYLYGIKNS